MAKPMPRRVRSQEERNKGRGNFITLKNTGDQFLGYALFAADPELDDNPGYYEYFEHYTPATGYVACSDENCPLCAEGDNPNTRAKSMWLVINDEEDDPDTGSVKIFNLNWSMVQDFAEDGTGLLGQLYRIKRNEGKGNYSIRPKTAKLTKTQLKAALKGVDENQLEGIVVRQMARVLEEMDVASAMEEDDDDDAGTKEPASKSRKGTAKAAPEPEPDDDDDDDDNNDESSPVSGFDPEDDTEFEGNAIVVKVNKRQNTVTVTEEGGAEFVLYGTDVIDVKSAVADEVYTVSASKDDDGDFVLDMWEAAEENGDAPADAAELPDSLDAEAVTITKVNPSPEDTLEVELADGTEFTLFFMGNGETDDGKDWSDFDIDDYNVGDKVKITAHKDEDGDMVADLFPVKGRAKATTSRAKTGGRK